MIKILNCYAGIGGNRKLWENCEVTAIEINPFIAKIYKDHFPNDEVIVTDAHEYLLNNYFRFDFVWISPPCPTHSGMRQFLAVNNRSTLPIYPDMKLWQEIILMQYNAKNVKWVIECVKPYYQPLIQGVLIQRHLFWSNFELTNIEFKTDKLRSAQIPDLEKHHGFDLSKYKIENKRKLLRNCVYPELGLSLYKDYLKTLK